MGDLHTLSPVPAASLGLAGPVADGVAGLSSASIEPSTSLRFAAGELARAVIALPSSVTVIVFCGPDQIGDTTIADMVERVREPDVRAVARSVDATQAIKRVNAGVVIESVDRRTVRPLRPPEVVDRAALTAALGRVDAAELVNPTELVVGEGGRLVLVAGP